MKMLKKFFISILISALIVSFTPVAHADLKEDFTGMIQEILIELFVGVGDGILYMVSTSVGELVTTDGIIYNDVDKVNVNYWPKKIDGSVEDVDPNSVKGILSAVVIKWSDVFFTIAIIVYMMVLVVAGIQVLLHGTADKKAQYKEYLVSWVVGLGILFLFPYVMKYTVLLNESAVGSIAVADRGETPPEADADAEKSYLSCVPVLVSSSSFEAMPPNRFPASPFLLSASLMP